MVDFEFKEEQVIQLLVHTELSVRQIAKKCRVAPSTVSRIKKRNQLRLCDEKDKILQAQKVILEDVNKEVLEYVKEEQALTLKGTSQAGQLVLNYLQGMAAGQSIDRGKFEMALSAYKEFRKPLLTLDKANADLSKTEFAKSNRRKRLDGITELDAETSDLPPTPETTDSTSGEIVSVRMDKRRETGR